MFQWPNQIRKADSFENWMYPFCIHQMMNLMVILYYNQKPSGLVILGGIAVVVRKTYFAPKKVLLSMNKLRLSGHAFLIRIEQMHRYTEIPDGWRWPVDKMTNGMQI